MTKKALNAKSVTEPEMYLKQTAEPENTIGLSTKSAPYLETVCAKNAVRLESAGAESTLPAESAETVFRSEEENRENTSDENGLLRFRKWWELVESDFYVNGGHISGIPIFIEHGTLRVVNKDYSYFIPLEKIDYIRTPDGLSGK